MTSVDSLDLPEDPDDRNSNEFAAWLDALAHAEDDDELFATLARQRPPASKLARQQVRGRLVKLLAEKLKEIGSGGSAARIADAWLQEGGSEGGDGDDGLQGASFVPEEVEPWESRVEGADVLDETAQLYDAYVFTTEDGLTVLALWVALTHIYDVFGVAPLLDLSSPTKRCGKSTAVIVTRHLCHAPLLSGNISPASLFRAVEAWKPTLLIDEADTFAKMNDELRGIINSGHTRDTAFVVRAEGDTNEPRLFSTWAPKLVAAIGRLPDTIEDRSVRLVLTRKPTSVVRRDAFDFEAVRRDCHPVRRRLVRFTLDNLDQIAGNRVERPPGLHDRAWNNWRPLLAIAAAAGGDWPARAERAALTLTGASDDVEDVGTLALQHVWEALKGGRLPTEELLRQLIAREDGPWAKWWEAAVAKNELKSPAARLARLLKPFGIRPQQLWIDGRNQRGYDGVDFAASAVAAYLEKDAGSPSHARRGSATGAASSVPSEPSESLEVQREGGWPLVGDPGYPLQIDVALSAGVLTEAEHREMLQIDRLVRRRDDGGEP